jgi:hypothetical protein
VTFCNVVVNGKPYPPSPDITYNANRTLSFEGNTLSGLLWRSQSNPINLQFWLMNLGVAPSGLTITLPGYTPVSLFAPRLTGNLIIKAKGDFFGDGYESLLVKNVDTDAFWLWRVAPETAHAGIEQLNHPFAANLFSLPIGKVQ